MITENEEIKPEDLPEFDFHKLIIKLNDPRVGLRGFIAIHRQNPFYPALGATRYWKYSSEKDALRDALRLSRLMSYKSAVAGLPYTGAKAVLIRDDKIEDKREDFFRAYAREINKLNGRFVTGADVGVYDSDINILKQETNYVIGCNVNSGFFTALGVFNGIKICLEEVFKSPNFKSKSFAIQGLGKTGISLVKLLSQKGAKLIGTDIDDEKLTAAQQKYPDLKIVAPTEIHKQTVDVFCPCALHGVLNKKTVAELNCRIVAGSANNQLTHGDIGKMLHEKGILYAPDYVINAGGLIGVVDEFEYGMPNKERIRRKLLVIKDNLKLIFDESKKLNQPPHAVANAMAEKIIKQRKTYAAARI